MVPAPASPRPRLPCPRCLRQPANRAGHELARLPLPLRHRRAPRATPRGTCATRARSADGRPVRLSRPAARK